MTQIQTMVPLGVLTYLRDRFADRPAWVGIEPQVHQIRQDRRS